MGEVSDDPWVLLGLDGEMSSADLDSGGRLIQAGAAVWADRPGGRVETFTSLIRHDAMEWSDRAAQVHGISRAELEDAPSAAEVDTLFGDWLAARGAVPGRRVLVPVGLNVAAFDMPFFRQALPGSASLFARRAVDLNAMFFTFAGWDPNPRLSAVRDFAGWKRSMKAAANAHLAASGVPVREHDAGFDAAQALVGWWWLREQLVELTGRVGALEGELAAADPLRDVLGGGLLGRLSGVPRPLLEDIVGELDRSGVAARRWFGTFRSDLGATPLVALLDGRAAEVLTAAAGSGSR